MSSSVLYKCNNYTCQQDSNGNFATLEECNSSCKPSYICHTPDDGFPQCQVSNSLSNQLKSAEDNLQKWKNRGYQEWLLHKHDGVVTPEMRKGMAEISFYEDTIGQIAEKIIQGHDTQYYDTLTQCQNNCKPKYNCDLDTLTVFPHKDGSFNSLEEAENNCQPRFTCDTENYVVMMDPRGEFKTSQAASLNCAPPIIAPQTKLTSGMIAEENAINENLKGQLQSDTLRLNADYLHMIIWGVLCILFLYMIFYFVTNKNQNLFENIIIIIVLVILILIIFFWAYNYFKNNPIKLAQGPIIY